jgi:hypothetical protein
VICLPEELQERTTGDESSCEEEYPAETSEPELKRVIGAKLLLLFIVGDILGTAVYALMGTVAKEVGGAASLPFLIAFALATVTACSYLELVTKYPQAAGAAIYAHKAFGIHFITFLVAFAVMCSAITSSSMVARRCLQHRDCFGIREASAATISLIAIGFIVLVGALTFRGVGADGGAPGGAPVGRRHLFDDVDDVDHRRVRPAELDVQQQAVDARAAQGADHLVWQPPILFGIPGMGAYGCEHVGDRALHATDIHVGGVRRSGCDDRAGCGRGHEEIPLSVVR